MHRRIVTVTLNPSIDVTLWSDGLHPDQANRVLRETREVGGKGINVSRVVHTFGLESLSLAVAGKDNAGEFARFLEQDGLRYELLEVEGAVRENLTLRCDGETLKLNRKGPSLSALMIGALMALIRGRVRPGDIVVFAGSLPENVPVRDYVELIQAVKNTGVLVALDSDVLTLADYRRVSPWLIKPNIHELRHILEVAGPTVADIADAARVLHDGGVENVLVSLGGSGLICLCDQGLLQAAVPPVEVKSTVGAGDSALAGFITGFVKGSDLADCVRLAAACGSAAVMEDGTAVATKEGAAALLGDIQVRWLERRTETDAATNP